MDKNEISNITLGLISNGQIIDISDNSARARYCALNFNPAAEQALAYHDWSFARRYCKPVLSAEKHLEYKYTYIYPADCLKLRRFINEDGYDLEMGGYKIIVSDSNSSRLILTNHKIESMAYTFKQLNTEMWDSAFTDAFEYLLASKIVANLKDQTTSHKYYFELYMQMIDYAKSLALEEETPLFETDVYKNYRPIYGTGGGN